MKLMQLFLGFLTGAFVVVASMRVLKPRDPSENVEGVGGADS